MLYEGAYTCVLLTRASGGKREKHSQESILPIDLSATTTFSVINTVAGLLLPRLLPFSHLFGSTFTTQRQYSVLSLFTSRTRSVSPHQSKISNHGRNAYRKDHPWAVHVGAHPPNRRRHNLRRTRRLQPAIPRLHLPRRRPEMDGQHERAQRLIRRRRLRTRQGRPGMCRNHPWCW